MKNKRLAGCYPVQSNVRWEADLTFVYTAMGNVYLFVIEDVYDQEVLSGQMDIRCGSVQAIECLKEAIRKRFMDGEVKGLTLTLRIDRGCQFTASAFTQLPRTKALTWNSAGFRLPMINLTSRVF